MTTDTTPDWERRCTALWAAFDDHAPAEFRAAMTTLTDELPAGHAVAHFENASACDATDLAEDAATRYREALAAGLPEERRRQAVIQLASTLRTLGQPAASVELLTAERALGPTDLTDAVTAFLALSLLDLGQEREAAALALGALSRHLPTYHRSVAHYAEQAAHGTPASPGPSTESSPPGA